MACTCTTSLFIGGAGGFDPFDLAQHCTYKIILTGEIEAVMKPSVFGSSCFFYSIGNEMIGGTVTRDCTNCKGCNGDMTVSGNCCDTCKNPQVIINGQVAPALICDGTLLDVKLSCDGYSILLPIATQQNGIARCCFVAPFRLASVATTTDGVIKIDPRKLARSIRSIRIR